MNLLIKIKIKIVLLTRAFMVSFSFRERIQTAGRIMVSYSLEKAGRRWSGNLDSRLPAFTKSSATCLRDEVSETGRMYQEILII